MKKILGFLVAFALCFTLTGGAAKADPQCISYSDTVFRPCIAYETFPGGSLCTNGTTPAANEVLVWSGTNYSGFCARVPLGDMVNDFGTNGWKNSIRSMKVGTSVHAYGCNSNQFNWGNGWGCSIMGSPYGQNFSNTSGSQNWGSFEVY